MKEFILERGHLNVNIVASVLADNGTRKDMKEFILERGLLNVNIVASVFNVEDI